MYINPQNYNTMIKTHTIMLCISCMSITSILTIVSPYLGLIFNAITLITLYVVLIAHNRQKVSLGPANVYDGHIIQALVKHIKETDKENLYTGSLLEEQVTNYLKEN